jgi:hypothetical protein
MLVAVKVRKKSAEVLGGCSFPAFMLFGVMHCKHSSACK